MDTTASATEEESLAIAPEVDGITANQFKKLGDYLMQGMNEYEAAVLAGIDKAIISMMRRTSAEYNNYVEKKKLEFKRKHLKILSTKADPKISQWLLERLNPEEFNGKAKKVETPQNVVAAIIKDIQNNSDGSSSLAFAYKDDIVNDGSEAQRASRDAAEDRIRQVLL